MNGFQIINTTPSDWDTITWPFQKAMELQGKNGYKVWAEIDESGLKKDIENGLQYKVIRNDAPLCVFSVQFIEPFIWRGRYKGDAIYCTGWS